MDNWNSAKRGQIIKQIGWSDPYIAYIALEPLHVALDAVAGGDRPGLRAGLYALSGVGNGSGFDALAGMWLAANAVLTAGVSLEGVIEIHMVAGSR